MKAPSPRRLSLLRLRPSKAGIWGDDNRLKAAYRVGCRACQNLPKGGIRPHAAGADADPGVFGPRVDLLQLVDNLPGDAAGGNASFGEFEPIPFDCGISLNNLAYLSASHFMLACVLGCCALFLNFVSQLAKFDHAGGRLASYSKRCGAHRHGAPMGPRIGAGVSAAGNPAVPAGAALLGHGCRAQLRRVLARLDSGDVLMVTLARSTGDLLNTLAASQQGRGLGARGAPYLSGDNRYLTMPRLRACLIHEAPTSTETGQIVECGCYISRMTRTESCSDI